MVDQPDGLRERKKHATKLALAHAAVRLCLRHGVEKVTVDDIAAEAEVSPRTFFNYFACKEEAIVAESRLRAERLVTELAARPANESIADSLRAVVLLLLNEAGPRDQARRWAAEMRMLHRTPSVVPYQLASYAALERSLSEAIAARTGLDADRDLFPRVAASITAAGTRAALGRWLDQDEDVSLTELATAAFDQIAPALTPPVPATVRSAD
ncbi:TetR/AcrR family transcriptional regulator [Fodinicola acaciae]|uniref:TetR/AcrR family transcriptional regulator n=1 Tax=Fodinicola acaciae TaxID=2681555 RepID=UPI0013D34F2B|nr:TetR family transcriptional regulator [Fodinicola acaciae]